jgi:hypothetical protein
MEDLTWLEKNEGKNESSRRLEIEAAQRAVDGIGRECVACEDVIVAVKSTM